MPNFPNYAGQSGEEVENLLKEELEEADIPPRRLPFTLESTEVKVQTIGNLKGWTFYRTWRYWVAYGPAIPIEWASKLHEKRGNEVRVDGDAGCPHPRDVHGNFGISQYHVDSQEGLNDLAETIESVSNTSLMREMKDSLQKCVDYFEDWQVDECDDAYECAVAAAESAHIVLKRIKTLTDIE